MGRRDLVGWVDNYMFGFSKWIHLVRCLGINILLVGFGAGLLPRLWLQLHLLLILPCYPALHVHVRRWLLLIERDRRHLHRLLAGTHTLHRLNGIPLSWWDLLGQVVDWLGEVAVMVGELLGWRLEGWGLLGGRIGALEIAALSLIWVSNSLDLLHGIWISLNILLRRKRALEVVGLGGVDGVFVVVSCALGVDHLNMSLLTGILHV